MADSFYSFSEPLNSGVDFYFADKTQFGLIGVSADVTVQVTATKLSHGIVTLSADAVLTANSYKFAYAQANISDILSTTLTLGTKIQPFLVPIYIESSLVAVGTKIAYASSTINCTSSVATIGTKISFAASAISSAASVISSITKTAYSAVNVSVSSATSVISTRIAFASAAINSSVMLSIVGKISLATIRIAIQNMGAISATAIKFATSAIAEIINIDDSLIRTFLLLDESPITNHNRTIDMSIEPIFTEVKNWNNRSSRYYKSSSRAARRTFNLSWSWLPNSNSSTVDGKKGRDFIKNIASDPRSHVLKIINLDDSGTTPYTETSYNVLVKDYSETLIRRDIENGVYFWDCSISLEEV